MEKTDSEDMLEEWLKRDPYLLDTGGYLKFLEDKQRETRVRLTVSLNNDWTYSIFIELADVKIGDGLQPADTDAEEIAEIKDLERRFIQLLEKIDLRPGATYVFREGDKWYYWGDFDHCPREELLHNVGVLCKFWQAVGRQVKGAFGVSKAYDRSLYVDTLSPTKQNLPSISIIRYDMPIFRRNLEHQPTYPLEEFEAELSDVWLALETYAKRLLVCPEIDQHLWESKDELVPVAMVYREDVPSVERFLAKRREEWDPFNDTFIQRNGVFDLLHPALQKVLPLVWDESLVVWQPSAQTARQMYYKNWSREELDQKKVKELREICRLKRLDSKGRKDELIQRIMEFDAKLSTMDTILSEDVYDHQALF